MKNTNYAKQRIHEDFAPTTPPDDIMCKHCLFRKADLLIDGEVVVKGYKNGYCDIYANGKPNAILFTNAECEYYEPEE